VEKRGIRAFWHRKGGQVAIIFALMLLPILVVVGFAVDASRQVTAKRALQQATDVATLAAARRFAHTRKYNQSRYVGQDSFASNIKTVHSDFSCEITDTKADYGTPRGFSIETKCTVPTLFGKTISGQKEMTVKVKSKAYAATTTLDLALVMDNSNSMDSAAMTSLKTGAKKLVNAVLTADDTVRVALIPYSSTVNAGTVGFTAINRTPNVSRVVSDPENDGWDKVCLTERRGTEMYTDAAPGSGAWIGAPTNLSRLCDVTEMLPLSSKLTELEATIDAMHNPGLGPGGTGGHVGVAWGWYAISPEWATIWPTASEPFAYGNPDELKVMVIMTDGIFNIHYDGGARSPAKTRALCQAMKGRGVIVFTIAFDAAALPAAQTLMQDCASSPAHYFNATDTAALEDAYTSIASRYQGVGLTE